MTKDFVLRALEDKRGSWLSGEVLAEQLGISRQAVGKAVRALQQEGYDIEAVPRVGYRLLAVCDLISPEVIAAETGVRLCFRAVTASTNDLAAAEYLLGGECAAISLRQTAGRRKDGGVFPSPENAGIYLSYAFPLSIAAEALISFRNDCAAVVEDVLRQCSEADVQRSDIDEFTVGGKKAAGILVEVMLGAAGMRTNFAVVGVGIYTREIMGADCTPLPADQSRNRIVILLLQALRRRFVLGQTI